MEKGTSGGKERFSTRPRGMWCIDWPRVAVILTTAGRQFWTKGSEKPHARHNGSPPFFPQSVLHRWSWDVVRPSLNFCREKLPRPELWSSSPRPTFSATTNHRPFCIGTPSCLFRFGFWTSPSNSPRWSVAGRSVGAVPASPLRAPFSGMKPSTTINMDSATTRFDSPHRLPYINQHRYHHWMFDSKPSACSVMTDPRFAPPFIVLSSETVVCRNRSFILTHIAVSIRNCPIHRYCCR